MILLVLKDLSVFSYWRKFLSSIGYIFVCFWFFVCHLLRTRLICDKEMETFILKFIVLDIFSVFNAFFLCLAIRHKTCLGKKKKMKTEKVFYLNSKFLILITCRHPEMVSDTHTGEEGLFMSLSCNYMKTREETVWQMKPVKLELDDL